MRDGSKVATVTRRFGEDERKKLSTDDLFCFKTFLKARKVQKCYLLSIPLCKNEAEKLQKVLKYTFSGQESAVW